jgi:sterol desaturase/sphingolipid hydroxylase (fatty acid hydroxylase superfamily)
MSHIISEVSKATLILGSMNTLRYFLIAGFAFFIFYRWFPGRFIKAKIQAQQAGSMDFLREIKFSVLSGFITALIIAFVLKSGIKESSLIYEKPDDYPLYWLCISYLLAIIFHDTWFYWLHRFFHLPGVYERVHRIHHLSVNPSPWTSFSFHFLEAAGEGLVILPLVYLVPLHVFTLVFFGLSIFAINVYGHLGYEIAPRWFRRSIFFEFINSSVYHNIHHSKFRGNYGLYFRIWDRLMGTEHNQYEKIYDEIQAKRFSNQERTKVSA